jgi:hypothetical protein
MDTQSESPPLVCVLFGNPLVSKFCGFGFLGFCCCQILGFLGIL